MAKIEELHNEMFGNVWEWVNDWYDPNYYSYSPYKNPTGPSSPVNGDYGPSKVLRGGAYCDSKWSDTPRCSFRDGRGWMFWHTDGIGFRTAMDINDSFSVSGKVLYYSRGSLIKEVKLTISGSESLAKVSDSNGYYEFTDLVNNMNYSIMPSKPENTDIGDFTITTYDAALTAQASVGVRQLTDYETIAADVNKDGHVYTFDAALIARYAVGLSHLSGSFVGEWKFVPDSMNYEPLTSDELNQNYVGIILGNVHGGWSQPGALTKERVLYKRYNSFTDIVGVYRRGG